MTVAQNNFAAKTPEGKAATLKNLHPNMHPTSTGSKKGEKKNRQLFSEVLNEIFSGKGGKKRLHNLALKAIEHAEKGHAQFLNLVLERLDGPVLKDIAPGNVNNFFFNEKMRTEALTAVEYIKNLKYAIPVLPEKTDGDESTTTATTE